MDIRYHPPFFFLLGGPPFVAESILNNLPSLYNGAINGTAFAGSILYLIGSAMMIVEIAQS